MSKHHPIITRRNLLAGLAAYPTSRFAFATPAPVGFRVFDGLLHQRKPRAETLGLESLPAVANVWRRGVAQDVVDMEGIVAALNQVPIDAETIFLDIEVWPLLQVSSAVRNATISKFMRVTEIVRNRRPSLKFGIYNVIPAHTYWPLATSQFAAEAAEWRAANQALRPLAELVDVVFPSLYTVYADHPGWLRFAGALLEAAHQYGKPVYPFLWFEYHDSNPTLRDLELEASVWRDQLRFCRSNADGVVLWGGYTRRWSESAAWWQIAKSELPLKQYVTR